MKKTIKMFSFLIIAISLSGCFKKDTMENITIYTTVYPVEYITNFLYGENAEVISIYPSDIDVTKYELTDKQLTDYSKGGLYIYNGISAEKDYAISMLNKNRRLKIIDAAMNLEYVNGVEELWLDPSNFLMLAQNIKTGFEEYITNPYLKNEINNNYENIRILMSEVDAELNLIAKNTEDKTLVVSNDIFLFLIKYGFNVISLDEKTVTAKKIADVKDLINQGTIQHIFTGTNYETSETVLDLIKNYNLELLTLNTGANLTEQERYDKITFIDIMNYNIDLIKSELYE